MHGACICLRFEMLITRLFYCLAIYSRCMVGGEMRPKRPIKTSQTPCEPIGHFKNFGIIRTIVACKEILKGHSNISGMLIHDWSQITCLPTHYRLNHLLLPTPHPPDESITKSVAVHILAVQQKKQMNQLDMMRTSHHFEKGLLIVKLQHIRSSNNDNNDDDDDHDDDDNNHNNNNNNHNNNNNDKPDKNVVCLSFSHDVWWDGYWWTLAASHIDRGGLPTMCLGE